MAEVKQSLPEGWEPLSGAANCPKGYVFISNRKSRFSKEYKTAIVPESVYYEWLHNRGQENKKKLNDLARHKMITRLYEDILIDMTICGIEGWNKTEYINLIKEKVDSIGTNTNKYE